MLNLIFQVHHHAVPMQKYVLAAAVIYAADRAIRLLKTRVVVATVSTIPKLGMTKIMIPSLNAGWRQVIWSMLRAI
jgi:ferric-chelate reductase